MKAYGLDIDHQPDRAPPVRRRRPHRRAQRARRRGAARRRLDARPLRRRDRRRQALRPRRGGEQERLRELHLRAARARSAGQRRSRAASSCTSPTTRNSAASSAPAGCCAQGLTKPDLMIAAGFSYEVVTAHNGCLQMEVTVHGKMAHAAIPTPASMRCRARSQILNALYAQNTLYQQVTSQGRGHHAPLPQRRPHRRRHQHQRRARQGGASSSTAA